MEPDSLPFSLKPSTGLYHETDESNVYLSKICINIVTCMLGNATVIHGRWFDTSYYWTFHLAELQLFTLQFYNT
jgi:hypothetical protein